MRLLVLAAALVLLAACGTLCLNDPSGLSNPPLGSSAPRPAG